MEGNKIEKIHFHVQTRTGMYIVIDINQKLHSVTIFR